MVSVSAFAQPVFAGPATSDEVRIGRRQSFDGGWRFKKGDGNGFEQATFNDAAWRQLDLPHDWSIEALPAAPTNGKPSVVGPFDRKAVGGTATGFTDGGVGWYRKHFKMKAPEVGRVEIEFDGVYMDSEVWINGHSLGRHPYGYTPFAYDLTPYLSASGDNVIAVRARNEGLNSRWYPGSGIYRHVWLDVFATPARLERWGVSVTTVRADKHRAELKVATRLLDVSDKHILVSSIRDAKGAKVWSQSVPASTHLDLDATISSPKLWSLDAPVLYTLVSELRLGSKVIDTVTTTFGVRVVTFDVQNGTMINGDPVKLRGGCIHHDHGILGAASFDAAEARKVRLLKARGYNAVRPSHNAFSPAFYDECDRQGMLVIGETFDCWQRGKNPDDYNLYFKDNWKADLTTIVRSQQNHPSIIMWSIGNEIPDRNLPEGVRWQWELANETHRLDPYRPVTAAINDFAGREVVPDAQTARAGTGGQSNESSAVFLDIVGYNYKLRKYAQDHGKYPSRLILGTESFPKDIFATWAFAAEAPYVLGDFVWTAMDYLGEAGIGGSTVVSAKSAAMMSLGAWPLVDASCGDLDLIGNQKGASLARDVVWGLSDLEVCVQKPLPDGKAEAVRMWGWSDEWPCWTWPGAENKPLAVRIYTSGDKVELKLNGRSVLTQPVAASDLKHIEVKVEYAPGVLEVIAYRSGKIVGRKALATSGDAATVRVQAEASQGGARRGDVSFFAVDFLDSKGIRVPQLEKDIHLSVSGPAELVGFGTGRTTAAGSFQAQVTQSFDGRALVALRGTGKSGVVTLTASSPGLKAGTAKIRFS